MTGLSLKDVCTVCGKPRLVCWGQVASTEGTSNQHNAGAGWKRSRTHDGSEQALRERGSESSECSGTRPEDVSSVVETSSPAARLLTGSVQANPTSPQHMPGANSEAEDSSDDAPALPRPWYVNVASPWFAASIHDKDGETVLVIRGGGIKEQNELAWRIAGAANRGDL